MRETADRCFKGVRVDVEIAKSLASVDAWAGTGAAWESPGGRGGSRGGGSTCIYIYIYIYIHMYVCIYIYICVYIHVYM